MTTASSTTPAPAPRKRKWLRWLLGSLGGLLILLVALYFVATSSAFFKGVILPRAGEKLNARITVADASIHPFSSVHLTKVSIVPTGKEPLLEAEEITARYSLGDILKGNIVVAEVSAVRPVIHLAEDKDRDSNLDPILRAVKGKESKPAEKSSSTPQIRIGKIEIQNGRIIQTKDYGKGFTDRTELNDLSALITDVRNGGKGKASLAAALKMESRPPGQTNSELAGTFKGDFEFELTPQLMPAAIHGNSKLAVTSAGGSMADLAQLGADLVCDATPEQVRNLTLQFSRGSQQLGKVLVTGKMDAAKLEGDLNVQLLDLDRQVLKLASAMAHQDLDFANTRINSTNHLVIQKQAQSIDASGQLQASQLSVTRAKQTTPPLDFGLSYQVQVDRAAQKMLLSRLVLDGKQNARPLLHGELNKPMPIQWGKSSDAVGDSDLLLTVTNLDLAEWKAFLGDIAPRGLIQLRAGIVSRQAGKNVSFDLDSGMENLSVRAGTNQFDQVRGALKLKGSAADLNLITLEQFSVNLNHQGADLVQASGSGRFQKDNGHADFQVTSRANLPAATRALSTPGISAASGTVDLNGRVTQQGQTRTFSGTLTLADFTGQVGSNKFQQFATTAELDAVIQDQDIQVRKASGRIQNHGERGGEFAMTGGYHLGKQAGRAEVTLTDLNQNALQPFLSSALGDKTLVSVNLKGSATAQYDASGESSVKSDIQVANLLVRDPQNTLPSTPLEARLKLDATMKQQLLGVRELIVGLTPTERAKNELRIAGSVPLSATNARPGRLMIESDSLDVTRYYEIFGGSKKSEAGSTEAKPARGKVVSKGPATPSPEPAAVQLPISQAELQLKVGRFFLRELVISNLNLTANVQSNRVQTPPFQFTMNGQPVSGALTLDLSVPGYRYDIDFSAQQVPVGPFVNSFMEEYKGRFAGDIIANAKIKGAGVTGSSLQKNLAGTLGFTFTNANIQLAGPKMKAFFTPIAIALQAPELLETPLNWVNASATMGDGKIVLKQLRMLSAAFTAETAGDILIRPELTESPLARWPMQFALRRSLAEKTRIISSDAAKNEAYVALPNFIRVAGTLGDPKAEIDKVGLAAGLLQRFGSKIGDEKTGKLLQGLGGVISGDKNKEGSEKPTAEDLLDLFKKPKKK